MAITYHAGRRIQGNITTHKVHTFTTTGNSTFQITSGSGNVEYLVVAGGAGGGSGGAGGAGGGGGGAGGARTGSLSLSTSTGSSGSHTVTVGALGAGATTTNTLYNAMGANARGSNGVNSVFDSITSTGGGGGAAGATGTYGIGVDGGSGGGDGYYQGAGSGISGQGHDGGDSSTSSGDWNGGGGGGAGAAGDVGTSGGGGAGGAGLQSSINGTATYYAGGGGGAVWQDSSITGGAGGSSLGGAGGNYNSGGSDATGYGSGGGGGGVTGSGAQPSYAGGDGSQGIVILRYNPAEITATGGTITETDVKDIKPTNVQVGSRFEETDTRKMYSYENGLEYEDNFSSNGDWVFTTSNASITGGVLQCTQYRSANDSATVSVGTSIGTKFLQQFEYEVDVYPSGTGASAYYGLWSLPNTTGANTGGQDFVVLHNNDGVLHKISVGQNTSAYGGSATTGSTWITLTVGTKYYIELIGNGDDTYTLNIRTVSHTGSHVTNSPQTVTKTGLSNLQYFGFKNTTGGGNGGTVTKTDDLKIYKGITTAGNVWSEIGT